MNHTAKLIALLIAFAIGCADQPFEDTDNTESATAPSYSGYEMDGIVYLAPSHESGSVCECTDQDCVGEWVEENLGCGLCVSFECVSGVVGGCFPCPLESELESELAVAADAPQAEPLMAPIDDAQAESAPQAPSIPSGAKTRTK